MHLPEERWPMCAQVQRQAEFMDRMMRALGVDAGAAARKDRGEAFAKARTECLNCGASHRCQEWLEAPKVIVSPPSFCPNASFFQEVMSARH